jgi:5-methylcytosine-specific restriction endonuclease McrBC regulatory subunit McrC
MLLEVMSVEAAAKAATKLVQIDWNAKQISIEQQHDQLTPFLVVQFLQLLKGIVQKGLKKSYYKVQEHLTNRVKGKILVGQHIKQNVFRNRFTQTYCEYQVFGVDNTENRFLKKVLEFAVSYVENNAPVFQANKPAIAALISYCYAAFENIGDEILEYELKHFHSSPFFKEYKETIQIGRHILKRFSYTITHTSQRWIATPPFWIDMPELFELYVYAQMVKHNSLRANDIHYQFSTYGNALDILVKDSDTSMVIDTKYKLHYQYGQIHDDIRQVSGYARLQAVRRQLNIENDRTIDCLIIYPDVESGITNLSFNSINRHRVEIPAYYRVYKLGIGLPVIGLYNCIP